MENIYFTFKKFKYPYVVKLNRLTSCLHTKHIFMNSFNHISQQEIVLCYVFVKKCAIQLYIEGAVEIYRLYSLYSLCPLIIYEYILRHLFPTNSGFILHQDMAVSIARKIRDLLF